MLVQVLKFQWISFREKVSNYAGSHWWGFSQTLSFEDGVAFITNIFFSWVKSVQKFFVRTWRLVSQTYPGFKALRINNIIEI